MGIDNQELPVPFHLLSAGLDNSEISYICNLERSSLKERYKNYQLKQRNEKNAKSKCTTIEKLRK